MTGNRHGQQPRGREAAIAAFIERCWFCGVGIGQTIIATRRNFRATVSFEQVRAHFAALAEQDRAPRQNSSGPTSNPQENHHA